MSYEAVFRNVLFPLYERGVKHRGTVAYLEEYERSQWLDREALQALQLRKLNALVDHCWNHIPFLAAYWRDANVRQAPLRDIADLQAFPILTKRLITDNFADMRSRVPVGRVFSKATSGSTAEPFRYEYSEESYARRTAVMWRGYRWCGSEIGRRSAYLWAPARSPSRLTRFKDRCYQTVFNRLILDSGNLSDPDIERFAAQIDRFRPRVVVGYVNPLLQMSRYLLERGRRLHRPDSVIAAAEPLAKSARILISQAFDAPVHDTYGCREFMLIASECSQRDGLHANTDHLVVEIVDDAGHAVTDVAGDLCITDLHNYAMPLVRYLNGDRAAWANRSCACGRALPLLRSIDGRVLDLIRGADGRVVSGELLTNVVMEFPQVQWFQLVQDSQDALEVRIVPRAGLTEAHRLALLQGLRTLLGQSMHIWLNEVADIPLTSAGKRRVTVSNL